MVKMRMLRLLPLLVVAALVSAAAARTPPPPPCKRECGGVEIPYPFGIGQGCYLKTPDSGLQPFNVTCSHRTDNGVLRPKPVPIVDGNLEVLSIDVPRARMRVRGPVSSWCYNATTRSMDVQSTWWYNLSAFRISGSGKNKLVAVGCNALGYIGINASDVEYRDIVGCRATCSDGARPLAASINGSSSCDGTDGRCQASIPAGIRQFEVSFLDRYNISGDVAKHNPCSYAMVVEAAAFEFRTTYVTTDELSATGGGGQRPIVLDWTVSKQTCGEAKKNKTGMYACVSANSECVDSNDGWYLCRCKHGYRGNPYLDGGCHDIDECTDKEVKYQCRGQHATCHNTPGDYKCVCRLGSRNKDDKECEIDYPLAAIGISIGVVVVTVSLTCTYLFQEKKRLAAIKKRYFQQHGGRLLFEEMKSRQGQGHSFKLFTKEELEQATDRFDERHVLGKGGNGTVYRGDLRDGRVVAIKRCRLADDERQRREFGKEMLILSQVNHRSIVKLYGCCLEVEVPMLVYQFIPNGTLYQLIHGSVPPPFAVRVTIAQEAAEALAYLHSMASPPIIHGDVKSANILLDENYTAKVSDFGASVLAPTDEAHLVSLVQGTCGYLDPEYMQTCRLTDKSDVYSFGVVLLELLTCRKALTMAAPEEERSLAAHFLAAMRDGRVHELLDARITGEVSGEVLEMVAALAKRCLEMSGEKRPSMREVAEEIDRIRKLGRQGWLGETSIPVNDR